MEENYLIMRELKEKLHEVNMEFLRVRSSNEKRILSYLAQQIDKRIMTLLEAKR